ncbi:uncharacterized protein Z518_08144 [Rhinocladiella mackenziei CBS 650.93]|uniref:Uncharacterized protein n=1 Tax=Rhinocladiella mackenziei CBS 650.93 TaxID=1442369 RepID=A0A0D2IZZ1_9EURO|nr:uncharacterized protein Z518_08144 [Rhinocladiella mackenziei CBS 650.93]KIX02205.1 hypothetical protein Z518_08144 [Rhinocladiella mackenziei CBS 650.93]
MKSFVAASVLALVSASAATPSSPRYAKRTSPNGCGGDPGAVGVADTINRWNSDVVTVNSFLEVAPTLDLGNLLVQLEITLNAA